MYIEDLGLYYEEELGLRLFLLSFGIYVIVMSMAIPVYGYFRRRWKGVAKGCLMQLVVCAVVIGVFAGGTIAYVLVNFEMDKKSAMVTVRSIEKDGIYTDTLTWYLKADEECIVDYEWKKDHFDVIRLDSLKTSVCVEDRMVVRFDIENEKVIATNYDQPIEVVDVKWDKVKAYFNQ